MVDSDLLDHVPLFRSMPERARAAVTALLDERHFPDGAVLLEQGSRSGGVYVLLSGAVRVQRALPGDRTVDLVTLRAGALFGTLAVLDGGVRAASCVAKGPVHVAVLPRTAFLELMDGTSEIALRFQLAVVRDLFADVRATNQRLVELAALPEPEFELEALSDRVVGLQ